MSQAHTVVYTQRAMATDFSVKLRSKNGALAIEALGLASQIEQEVSAYLPHSDLGRLHAAPTREWVPISRTCLELLRLAHRVEKDTHGAFSVAFRANPHASLTEHVEWADGRARRLTEAARIDFGAIGKGYAVDRIAARLMREGVSEFMVSAGGSSLAWQGDWPMAWGLTRDADGDMRGVRMESVTDAARLLCLGISGISEQGEHVTGRDEQRLSALVAMPSAALADAYSTAVLAGAGLSDTVPHAWWSTDGDIVMSSEFNKQFKLKVGATL